MPELWLGLLPQVRVLLRSGRAYRTASQLLMASDTKHFHAGKEARRLGQSRMISDCRLSADSRQQWYDGWDYQNEQMRPPPTDEQRAQHHQFCEDLLKRLADS